MLTAAEVQGIEKFQQMEQTFSIEDVGSELDRRYDAIAALLRDREELVGLLRDIYVEEYYKDAMEKPDDYCDEVVALAHRVLAAIGEQP